jgi:WhiB family redox-sensing transcriptional regulator
MDDWQECSKRAACRGEDPAVFFPSVGGNAAKARAICSVCPVRPECLAYALADPESAGVWGGITERERRKLRGRWRRQRANRSGPWANGSGPVYGRQHDHTETGCYP